MLIAHRYLLTYHFIAIGCKIFAKGNRKKRIQLQWNTTTRNGFWYLFFRTKKPIRILNRVFFPLFEKIFAFDFILYKGILLNDSCKLFNIFSNRNRIFIKSKKSKILTTWWVETKDRSGIHALFNINVTRMSMSMSNTKPYRKMNFFSQLTDGNAIFKIFFVHQ